MDRPTLCLDIGSGTQDVLYFLPGEELDNCPKFVLPSPALQVARKIEKLSRQKKNIHLYGHNMGGGFARVLKRHLQQGGKASITSEAAFALSDSRDRVLGMDLEIRENPPAGNVPVYLSDFDPGFWQGYLAQTGLDYPELILASVQDHGFHPRSSNRLGRFEIWKKFLLQSAGFLHELIFDQPPAEMTRLISLKQCIGTGLVCDTGAAALLGALFDPEVERLASKRGICVVNVGNSHAIAFLVYENRVLGIYEHHTGLLNGQKLWTQLDSFKTGILTNEQVFEDQGHGCLILDEAGAEDFGPTFVLGPRRRILTEFDVQFICPGGDVMLAGCFGLLKGAYIKEKN